MWDRWDFTVASDTKSSRAISLSRRCCRPMQTDVDLDHVNDLGWTALLEAVILGDGTSDYQQIVQILLAAGADPDIPDSAGVTALQHAQARGYRQIARLLRR